MSTQSVEARRRNGTDDPLAISQTEDGFRVYAAGEPGKTYLVTGSPEAPACTCSDFEHDGKHCRHIVAVLQTVAPANGRQQTEGYESGERSAIREEALPAVPVVDSAAQMLLKRSVSQNGRIDSLSVEFSCPVDGARASEITSKAARLLALQDGIVARFLKAPSTGGSDAPPPPNGNGAPNGVVSAEMLRIGGITTKWGRRLFISVQANGEALKLFGSRKQLAEAIVATGCPQMAERIDEGVSLNIPCRVTTKPSEDGRYCKIDRVLPPSDQRGEP